MLFHTRYILISVERRVHGINGGINGGRACWAIAGTFYNGKTQGSIAEKIGTCLKCDFYKPARIATDEKGRLYVTDSVNNRIYIYKQCSSFKNLLR